MFSPQIHIVFNAKEEKRLTEPILKNIPNKIYYFTAIIRKTGQKDVNMSYYDSNTNYLKKNIPNLVIEQREVDYTNYIEIIQEISKIVHEERDENPKCTIYINVSSGSKMTALASVEASKIWDLNIYYVYASEYDPDSNGPLHTGEMYMMIPTTFPIEKPEKVTIQIVKLTEELIDAKYLHKKFDQIKPKFIYKKDLLLKMYDQKLITLEKENKDERKRLSSLYMKSNRLFAKLSEELNYIEISNDKRNKKVYLTDTGKNILQIFRYLI